VGVAVVNPFNNFKECSFIHSRSIEGVEIFYMGHMTQTMPLSLEIFHPKVNSAILDPFAKFEERSFIHSRNIEGV